MVDQDGSVYAAVPDRAGSSRYFERLALEAAKKWTFSPIDTPSRRLVQIHFDFSRDGTTAQAVPLD
jgi:outer membrane biosynthesis protein TonB